MARVIHTRRPTIPAIQPRKRVAAYARVSIEKETMIESLVAQVGYDGERDSKPVCGNESELHVANEPAVDGDFPDR